MNRHYFSLLLTIAAFAVWLPTLAYCEAPLREVKLFFLADGYELSSVTRNVAESDIIRDTLKELFRGPTDAEAKRGLRAAFLPSALRNTSGFEGAQPLIDYFRGVRIQGGLAIVDFRDGAMRYLNNTASIQHSVKAPIEATLKQFPNIQRIEYSIDGKIVEGWDA
jgi:spore germination protein GerM